MLHVKHRGEKKHDKTDDAMECRKYSSSVDVVLEFHVTRAYAKRIIGGDDVSRVDEARREAW